MSDCDAPTVYNHTTPKARKSHFCCECRGLILPGEHYHRYFGVWEGDAESFKRCQDCDCLACDLTKAIGDDECGVPFTGLEYAILDWINEPGCKDFLAQFRCVQASRQPLCTKGQAERLARATLFINQNPL